MIQPRNTLILLRIIEKAERKSGSIVVPTNGDLYAEAEIVAIGPGTVAAAGGVSETNDLKAGQLVFIQHKQKRQNGVLEVQGVRYEIEGRVFYIYEQTSILLIVAQPGEWSGGSTPGEKTTPKLIVN